jgi:hypothetical protein
VGEVIGTVAALTAAGLDVKAINTETGIDIGPNDKHVHAINGALLHDGSKVRAASENFQF